MSADDEAMEDRSSIAPEREEERLLVWAEYLVLQEAYDRRLPGSTISPDLAAVVGADPATWLVDPASLPDSVAYARRQHARTCSALRTLLGRDPSHEGELAVVERLMASYPTHADRLALLAGRSPIDELAGPDILAPEKPQ
jgi:hypothetical protein